jgi:hypothetical protein
MLLDTGMKQKLLLPADAAADEVPSTQRGSSRRTEVGRLLPVADALVHMVV